MAGSALSRQPSAGLGGGTACGRFYGAASVRLHVYLFNSMVSLCFILNYIKSYISIEAGIECFWAPGIAACESGKACVHLHVLVIVGPLGESLVAYRNIAHKGSLSGVDPEMICEVVSLFEKSSIRIIAKEAVRVAAFPDLQLSLCVGVDEGVGTIR